MFQTKLLIQITTALLYLCSGYLFIEELKSVSVKEQRPIRFWKYVQLCTNTIMHIRRTLLFLKALPILTRFGKYCLHATVSKRRCACFGEIWCHVSCMIANCCASYRLNIFCGVENFVPDKKKMIDWIMIIICGVLIIK